jgi:hypothetical protein
MNHAETSPSSRKSWFPFGFLLACYVLFDLSAPPIIDATQDIRGHPSAIGFLYGAITANLLGQFGALAAWGALGTGRSSVRWMGSLLATALLTSLLFVGIAHSWRNDIGWRDLRTMLRLLPLAFLAAQFPAWALDIGWGYRIVAVETDPVPWHRFNLRGLFFAITVAAAIFALLRVEIGSERKSAQQVAAAASECVVVGLVWGALGVLPCLLSVLCARNPASGCSFLAAYACTIALAAIGATSAPGSSDGLSAPALVFGFLGGAASSLCGSFFVLRSQGYLLRRMRIRSREE